MAFTAPREAAGGQSSSAWQVSRGQRVPHHSHRILRAEHWDSQHAGRVVRTMGLLFTVGGDFTLAGERLASRSTCAHRCTKERNTDVLGLNGQRQSHRFLRGVGGTCQGSGSGRQPHSPQLDLRGDSSAAMRCSTR